MERSHDTAPRRTPGDTGERVGPGLGRRELATVLAALRYYQAKRPRTDSHAADPVSVPGVHDGAPVAPLTEAEIEALAESLTTQARSAAAPSDPQVVLAVRRGVVDVLAKPRGVAVAVYDFDVEGDGEGLTRDPHGEPCLLLAWRSDDEVVAPDPPSAS